MGNAKLGSRQQLFEDKASANLETVTFSRNVHAKDSSVSSVPSSMDTRSV